MRQLLFTTCFIALLAWRAAGEPFTNRISVTVRGEGPDVILIPGLACSGEVWDATAKHLAGHYRVHIVQVAGFGGLPSRANAQGAVTQPSVDAIDAYIKSNKLKAPKVIGHSMGGLMGMMLAIQHPEEVGGLMVVDSLPFFSVLFGATDAAAATPQAVKMRDMVLNESQAEYAQGEEQFLANLVKSPEGRKAAVKWGVASDKSVVARALYEVMTIDIRPKLSQIKAPVTMLYRWDAASGMPQSMVDGVYQDNFDALPHKTLKRVDDSYHFIMLDQPEAFDAQVDKFLK